MVSAGFVRWELGGVGCCGGEGLCAPLEPSHPSFLGRILAGLISEILVPYLLPPSCTFSLIPGLSVPLSLQLSVCNILDESGL